MNSPVDSAAPTSQANLSSPPSSPKLKDRIENNPIVFFLGALLTGFLAGIGTYQGALKIVDYEAVPSKEYQALRDNLATSLASTARLQKDLDERKASIASQRWLRIKGIQGLTNVNARIVAFVNGRAFSYPSRTVWSHLRAGMPSEDFPLPNDARDYAISFQLLAVDAKGGFQEWGSQQVVEVKQSPFEGAYELFAFGIGNTGSGCPPGNTRGAPACGDICPPPGSTRGIPACDALNRPIPGLVQVQFEVR